MNDLSSPAACGSKYITGKNNGIETRDSVQHALRSLRVTPANITILKPNEIFVFGSNEAGIHGAGAARTALQWGAVIGQGNGEFGQTYAIPTKDYGIKTLEIPVIHMYVNIFLRRATTRFMTRYLVTEIGCGLAGHSPAMIAPLFRYAIQLENVYLPRRFWQVLEGES